MIHDLYVHAGGPRIVVSKITNNQTQRRIAKIITSIANQINQKCCCGYGIMSLSMFSLLDFLCAFQAHQEPKRASLLIYS
jgi:hypothetical protein